jgi:hypothetical protein
MEAVVGMHQKFSSFMNEVLMDTVLNNLFIDEMVSDFDGSADDKSEVLKWLSAAVGMGSALGGAFPNMVSKILLQILA